VLKGALSAITAAVVGVIASISVWFTLHVLFASVGQAIIGPLTLPRPELASFQPVAALLALFAAVLILWRHWPLPLVLVLSAMASWLLSGALQAL
jgi:chromate transporter